MNTHLHGATTGAYAGYGVLAVATMAVAAEDGRVAPIGLHALLPEYRAGNRHELFGLQHHALADEVTILNGILDGRIQRHPLGEAA